MAASREAESDETLSALLLSLNVDKYRFEYTKGKFKMSIY